MEREEILEEVSFLKGALKIYQPKKGYRFGLDAVLLANFVEIKPGEKCLEVGAGQGAVSFILLKKYPKAKIYLLEIEPLFLNALKKGIVANSFQERAFLIKGDALYPPVKYSILDVIFANPPYFKSGAGRECKDPLENLAKREKNFVLPLFIKNCAQLLKNGGRFYLIFTAYRMAEVIFYLKHFRLEPKVIRLIYPYREAEANLFLLKAIKGAKEEIRVLPPLFVYKGKGEDYTEEVKNYLTWDERGA
ncbi:MAG: tRNA1(Val) (adenine(37)-N6)-methyltransferase [Caldimicrobium sp.]